VHAAVETEIDPDVLSTSKSKAQSTNATVVPEVVPTKKVAEFDWKTQLLKVSDERIKRRLSCVVVDTNSTVLFLTTRQEKLLFRMLVSSDRQLAGKFEQKTEK
jgi:hypothetical protein